MESRVLQEALPLDEQFQARQLQHEQRGSLFHCRDYPLISVIIPAHNEEVYLPDTLGSLKRQNYPRVEIIVVANGCTDQTPRVAEGRCHRLIVLSQKSLGVARNLGARMAQGELLVFLDADTSLEPLTLQVIAQQFSKSEAAGTIKGKPDADTAAFCIIYALKNFVHKTSLHPGSSGVIVCWREDFLRVGGFDEGLEVRENSELMRRLKRFGKYKYIGDVTATTSMRRYEQCGVWPTVWLWIKLWFQTRFGDLHNRRYETVR
jgi:glycosyltransferase involved in cell wall biosynthesis